MTQEAAPETGVDGAYRQQVVDVMATVLGSLLNRADPVTEDMLLMDQLGLSSTLGLELLLALEDQLQILIDVELMGQDHFRTVGDVATFVANNSRPA